MIYFNLTNFLIQFFTFVLIFSMISLLSMTYYLNEKYSLNYINSNHKLRLKSVEKFVIQPNKNRLNDLFDILSSKEDYYQDVLGKLNLISFKELVNGANSNQYYQREIDQYLDLNSNTIKANDKFIKYLNNKSEYYSFKLEKKIDQQKFNKNDIHDCSIRSTTPNPVFLTAANKKYFEPLKEIVENIKTYFPDFTIYIYFLDDINDLMMNDLNNLCKDQCKIFKFDSDNQYKNKSPHVSNLVTYSWKPLIIQVPKDNLFNTTISINHHLIK